MRRFQTIKAAETWELDEAINAFALTHFIVNVDCHCYESQWYAFILYEVKV